MNFNEKMRYLRKKKGVSQDIASDKIGISISALRNYEKDRLAETDTLKRIQEYYKVPVEYLLNDNCINEEYNNIDIGEALKLSDKSIENIKDINSNTKTNIIDNFISNISKKDFWKKLDECAKLQKELKELEPIKKIQEYKDYFSKYWTKKSFNDYTIILSEDDYGGEFDIDYEKYYSENNCNYAPEDIEKILECINILKNNSIIGEELDDGVSVLDITYQYVTNTIETCIKHNSKIPLEELKTFFSIPDCEFTDRNGKLEILGFYISNELVRYIKDL